MLAGIFVVTTVGVLPRLITVSHVESAPSQVLTAV